MAHFRGTIQGECGQASRLGSKASGLRVEANSWQTRIMVEYGWQPKGDGGKDGENLVTIYAGLYGPGSSQPVTLFEGTEAELLAAIQRGTTRGPLLGPAGEQLLREIQVATLEKLL